MTIQESEGGVETGNAERKARKEAQKRAKAEHAASKKAAAAAATAAAAANGETSSGKGVHHRLDPRSQPASVQLSKALSYILRHGAVKEGLDIGADGFVRLDQVLARPRVRSISMAETTTTTAARKPGVDDVREIVASNDKQRFELLQRTDDASGQHWWVRAVQGHSLSHVDQVQHTPLHMDNLHLVSTGSPVLAIHGTNAAAWDAILASGGLKPMTRNHIHLAKGKHGDTDVVSGMRKSSTRLIYIHLAHALADNIPFSLSSNGVILTPGDPTTGLLPTRYFAHVHDQHGNLIWQQP